MNINPVLFQYIVRPDSTVSGFTTFRHPEFREMPQDGKIRTRAEQRAWENSSKGNVTIQFIASLEKQLTDSKEKQNGKIEKNLAKSVSVITKDVALLFINLLRMVKFENQKKDLYESLGASLEMSADLRQNGSDRRDEVLSCTLKIQELVKREQKFHDELSKSIGGQKLISMKLQFHKYWNSLMTKVPRFSDLYAGYEYNIPERYSDQQIPSQTLPPDFEFDCAAHLIDREPLPTTIREFAGIPVFGIGRITLEDCTYAINKFVKTGVGLEKGGSFWCIAVVTQHGTDDAPMVTVIEPDDPYWGCPYKLTLLTEGLDIYRRRKEGIQTEVFPFLKETNCTRLVSEYIPPQRYANIEEIES